MTKRSRFVLLVSIAALLLRGGNLERLCDSEEDVLCEKEDSSDGLILTRAARHSPGFCHEGWYTFDDKCFKILYGSSTWTEADRACRELNSSLVSIHSEEEQDFLKLLIIEFHEYTWIGLRRRASSSNEFYWTDSSPLDFTNWDEGEPKASSMYSTEGCVRMCFGAHAGGLWQEVPCNHAYSSAICQRRKDPALTEPAPYPSLCAEPPGWLKLRNSCFKVFDKTERTESWSRAQSLCKSYGGNLVYVNGWAVTTLLRSRLKGLRGPFWTGIKSIGKNKFTWLGTHPLVYSNWQRGQPEELEDQQACVATDTDGEWIIRECDERHPFICEVSRDVTAPTIGSLHPNMTCPYTSPKWHDLGGKYCYIIDLGAKLKWNEASCQCREEGGFLASFHSVAEVNVIRHYVKHHEQPLHIGLRRDELGSFVWSDESAVDFYNWYSQYPYDIEAAEQCVEMVSSSGRWNIVTCDRRYGYICSALKVPERNESVVSTVVLKADNKEQEHLGAVSIALIVMWVLIAMVVSAVALYYLRHSLRMRKKAGDNSTYSELK